MASTEDAPALNSEISCRCVHLRNLPRRPSSHDAFVRILLSCVDPQNKYAKDRDLPLPQIDLKQLPKDNRRLVLDKLYSSGTHHSDFETAKQSFLGDSIFANAEATKTLLSDFLTALQAEREQSLNTLTIGQFRKSYKKFQQGLESTKREELNNLEGLHSRIRSLERDICAGSKAYLSLLDHNLGIIGLSRTTRCKHQSEGFLTFIDVDSAQRFVETFKGKLMVQGRTVGVSIAAKESMLGAYLKEGKKGLDSMLRQKHKSMPDNRLRDEAAKKAKRHLRRLRTKLANKGLTEQEISRIIKAKTEQPSPSSQDSTKRPRSPSPEPTAKKRKVVAEVAANPPNKVLLVQNLPTGVTREEVANAFSNEGLVEVRLVGVRNLAFVEYDTVSNATNVKSRLGNSYEWNGSAVSVGFAK
ncbi:LAQU0S04e05688g1_1 [Lachancea quebecensis]|uniref:LAQU0S04e05688g1_1 n=1 Tax=Lachancea quebecensis TaxID=1654605 RepID=A0A0P1KQU7_9SACH|nr:LAQU0S04e05688g1_1 [Lachancea quebecensis]